MSIEFKTGNAGFRHDDETLDTYAVSDILIEVANAVRNGRTSGAIIDVNGNHVGVWEVS